MQDKTQLIVGNTAPNITLLNQKGETFDLYQILDSGQKVLLVFYPADDTPGCTTQLCGIRDIYGEYTKAGVTIVGVNSGDARQHQKFIDKHSYPFDILVDKLEDGTKRGVAIEYGAIGAFMGHTTTKRGVFLIDTDKTIIYQVWGQQNNQEILDFLKTEK